MPDPDIATAARVIAESVASAIEREHKRGALHPLMREALVVELLRRLLPAMSSPSGVALADACNWCLDHFAGFHRPAPQVASVDLADGSVTMRKG